MRWGEGRQGKARQVIRSRKKKKKKKIGFDQIGQDKQRKTGIQRREQSLSRWPWATYSSLHPEEGKLGNFRHESVTLTLEAGPISLPGPSGHTAWTSPSLIRYAPKKDQGIVINLLPQGAIGDNMAIPAPPAPRPPCSCPLPRPTPIKLPALSFMTGPEPTRGCVSIQPHPRPVFWVAYRRSRSLPTTGRGQRHPRKNRENVQCLLYNVTRNHLI
ncbi:uncharacterized protein BO80DRAFT_176666 [Aspergillus ibericus CBS 121593]|uniref:Uncharacterized protein n=1 Tax=Aspergillus ibericus CBS 121593 TaxID=1448316 RepID=A0A395HAW2_9EURO|nr:hypothetical protein BO80DRAFT_176666 [Aspergillus ibericus CBS 121593]RAL05091.1 hypothetical protein BO80DRAFT_176666 [Aspergillus ibericus CBS 121593]